MLLLFPPASALGLAGHVQCAADCRRADAWGCSSAICVRHREACSIRRRSNEVLGLILVKDLVLIDEGLRVSDIRMRPLPFLRADTPMYDLLQARGLGGSHLCTCLCIATAFVNNLLAGMRR